MRIGSALLIQASEDTCTSGGGTWDPVENVCVESPMLVNGALPVENANDIAMYNTGVASVPVTTSTIIPGVDDSITYIVGAAILYLLLRHHQ